MLRYGHSKNAAIRDLFPLVDFPKARTPKPRYAALTTKYVPPSHTRGAAHQPNVHGAATHSVPSNAKAKPYFTPYPSAFEFGQKRVGLRYARVHLGDQGVDVADEFVRVGLQRGDGLGVQRRLEE